MLVQTWQPFKAWFREIAHESTHVDENRESAVSYPLGRVSANISLVAQTWESDLNKCCTSYVSVHCHSGVRPFGKASTYCGWMPHGKV